MPPPTRRERFQKLTPYPLLWAAVYLLWLGFGAGLLFWLARVHPPALAAGLFLAMAVAPPALLRLSAWMQGVYDPDRPR